MNFKIYEVNNNYVGILCTLIFEYILRFTELTKVMLHLCDM